MKVLLFALLVAHGIAHLVGFVVPWRILMSSDMPYKTTILDGRLDLGASGIRAIGLLWLCVGLATMLAGAAWLLSWPNAARWTLGALVASLVLCLAEWPLTRIGLAVNVAVLIALPFAAQRVRNESWVAPPVAQVNDELMPVVGSDARGRRIVMVVPPDGGQSTRIEP